MAIETVRPTASSLTGIQSSSNLAYIIDTDDTTYGGLVTTGSDTDPRTGSRRYSSFTSRAQTWLSAELVIKAAVKVSGNLAGGGSAEYSTDGGSTWTEVFNIFGSPLTLDTYRISVSADTGCDYRVNLNTSGGEVDREGSGAGTIEAYDIRVEGTYDEDVLTSFSASPTSVNYGGTTSLTLVFTGTAPTVDYGKNGGTATTPAWGTWVSNTAQTSNALTTTGDNYWTATQASMIQLHVTVANAVVSNPTFSASPITVGYPTTVSTSVSTAASGYDGATFASDKSGTWTSGTGVISGPNPSNEFTPSVRGSHKITVTSQSGSANSTNTYLTVAGAPTCSIAASKTKITFGSATIITPTFTNTDPQASQPNRIGYSSGATEVTSSAVSGTEYTCYPGMDVTYYLWCHNTASDGGSLAVDSIDVEVFAAPTITSFIANPTGVLSGGLSNLVPTFTYDGAGSATIGTTLGGSQVTASAVSGANHAVYPTVMTTYYLRVTNEAGDYIDEQVTVGIVDDTPYIQDFLAWYAEITVGGSSDLQPIYVNADPGSARIGTTVNGTEISSNAASYSYHTVTPASTTTYYLRVINASGAYVDSSVTVTVFAAPTATSLTASNTNPLYGATITLTPVFSNAAQSYVGYSGNQSAQIATGLTSGVAVNTTITTTRTFTLSVRNAAYTPTWSYASSGVVTPQTVVVADISPATPTIPGLQPGNTFTSSVTGAVNTGITWTFTNGASNVGTITAGQGTNTVTWTAPSTAQTVTVRATAVDGTYKTTTITVTQALILKPTISTMGR